jgi:hypothetical protein
MSSTSNGHDDDNAVNYNYSRDVLPKDYQESKVTVERWDRTDGEIVQKGERIGQLKLEGHYGITVKLVADDNGALEIVKQVWDNKPLEDGDGIFTIHKNPSDSKLHSIKFKNVPDIQFNPFSKTEEIRWKTVAGRTKSSEYNWDIYDSFIFFADDMSGDKLIFTISNLEGRDFLIFKFPSAQYKLVGGCIVTFLFHEGEQLKFEIIQTPYKTKSHLDWGHIFETMVQLTSNELEVFQSQSLSNWQISFPDSIRKIRGSVDSGDIQKAFNELAKQYLLIVQERIPNYTPLIDRQTVQLSIESEACFVYLMLDSSNGYHKIGISNKPGYREKTLQSEKPTIEMLANKAFPNRKIASSFEQALHQTYADKRIRGEWFDLSEHEVQDLVSVLK